MEDRRSCRKPNVLSKQISEMSAAVGPHSYEATPSALRRSSSKS